MDRVRPPAVAGVVYPADPGALLAEVHRLLGDVFTSFARAMPLGVIVPHAGWRYSGPVAATAYVRLAALRGRVRTIILVGPAHHGTTAAVALSSATAFASPLGEVPVDGECARRALALPGVRVDDRAHAPEHCL